MKKLGYVLIALCAFTSLQCLTASQPTVDPDLADTTDVYAIPLDESAGEEAQDNATLKKIEKKEQKPTK